jgi:hypothetical protein
MSCYAPIEGFRSGLVSAKTGKRAMQFTRNGSFTGVANLLPCGNCIGCRLERSRQWAMRLMHENKMHSQSCFLTLTYSNSFLPDYGTLVPRDLQLFHKRLHNRLLDERGVGIRYYSCGEYGDLSKRPHYHSLVFGYDFSDKILYSKNSRDESIFSSKSLNDIWSLGECKIGEVTFDSAAYVARYCVKKVNGAQREAGHYLVYDADGVVHERVPEFAHMSRRPGIGATYFDKFGSEIATHDSVIVGGKEVPSIRYYDLKIEALDPSRIVVLKRNRRRKAVWFERTVDRRRVREVLTLKQYRMKERKL